MNRKERVRLAIANNCSASISLKDFPPDDLKELAELAAAHPAVTFTLRDCTEKDPTTLTALATIGQRGKFVFEF